MKIYRVLASALGNNEKHANFWLGFIFYELDNLKLLYKRISVFLPLYIILMKISASIINQH